MIKPFFLIWFLAINFAFSQKGLFWLSAGKQNAAINSPSSKTVGDFADGYDVKFYKLDLHASDTSVYLGGSVTVLFEITGEKTGQVSLDFSGHYQVDSIISGTNKLNYRHSSDSLVVYLGRDFTKNELAEIAVFYCSKPGMAYPRKGIFNSFNKSVNKGYTWTLSEPFSAKYWFPCRQVLTDKADSVYVFITTDAHLLAGSNGILTDKVSLPDNKIRYEWKSKYPVAYYLISFALGDYLDYSYYAHLPDSDSVLVQNFMYNDTAYFSENKHLVDATEEILYTFSSLFGKYPFYAEKYGHCVAPMGGGMEHQTMTTLSGFSFGLVAHELAHQWFGNLVTCSSWQDIWINEGFASYAEYLALEFIRTKSEADSWMASTHKTVKRSAGGSIYIPFEELTNEYRIFSMPLSYKKGAAILHMIRQEVSNDDLFFEILKEFLSVYSNSNASAEDFKSTLEQKTGKDFDTFFNQWFYGEGYPTYKINWFSGNDTLYIYSLQGTTSVVTPVFNTILEFLVQLPDGKDTLVSFRQSSNFNEFKVKIPQPVQGLVFDPDKYLLARVDSFINIADHIKADELYLVTPNPVKEVLNVRFRNQPAEYQYYLFNSTGNLIHSSKNRLKNLEVDLRAYSNGSYIFVVVLNDQFVSSKIIKI
ncbi:MAG: T9SS type A sorting domain-containing protein [Bacteroidales bacterium]|nr:T9SS type A sorting domain-containing protein [Bacteroidales bacterium]